MQYFPDFSTIEESSDEPLVIHRHGGPAAHALIILIHGLGGHRYRTWTPRQHLPTQAGLHKFLYEDVQGLDIGLYSYRTALRRLRCWRSIELQDEARVLADRIRENAGTYPAVLLAGHSMGGILARAAIRELIDRSDRTTLASVKGLILLATPMAGSLRVLSFLSWFSSDARALRPHGPLLSAIADVFTDRVVGQADHGKPDQFVIPAWVVAAAEDQWVDRFSAGLSVPRARINNVRGSHTSAVKPRTKTDDAYIWVLRVVRELCESVKATGHHEVSRLGDHLRDLSTISPLSRREDEPVQPSPTPEPVRATVAPSAAPRRDVVRFEIQARFSLADGFDGLRAKVNEVIENLAEKSVPPFEVECPWLDELQSQIDTIKKTPLPDRNEKELLALTKLRGEVRQKLYRVRWAFEILFTSPELREAIAELKHYLDDKAYAQCINGIIEIENYSALRLGSTRWFLFYRGREKRSCSVSLSDREMQYMEEGYYENDYTPPRRSGLRRNRVYTIAYFSPSILFGRVLPQILCHLSELPEELRRSPQLLELLRLSDWKFSKSPDSELPEIEA